MAHFEQSVDKILVRYALKANISADVGDELAKHIAAFVAAAPAPYNIVLEMAGFNIDYRAFRALGVVAGDLKKLKAQLFLLTTDREILGLLKQLGMEALLKPIASLAAVNPDAVCAARPRVDVNLINPFIAGTIQTLQVQCQTLARPEKPALKEALTLTSDIAGVICISSPSFNGDLSVCFPKETFLLLMSRMLGEPCPELTKDLEDGASEILNMISAHGKKVLSEGGLHLDRAIPTVVRGAGEEPAPGAIVLPFSLDGGAFHIEIKPAKAG